MWDRIKSARKLAVGAAVICVMAICLGLLVIADGSSDRDVAVPDTGHAETGETDTGATSTVGVAWANRPQSFEEMARRASSVVEATVVDVRPGPDLVTDVPEHPGGVDRIPTERIRFRVIDTLAGQALDEFTLFRTGSNSVSLEGSPPYGEGERYVMFVEPREGGADPTYLPVGPDGRLRERADGTVTPVIEGSIGRSLDGKKKAEIEGMVGRAR